MDEAFAADEAWLLYQSISMGGGIVEPLAAKLMDYWLSGKGADGKPYCISSSDVKKAMMYEKPEGASPYDQLRETLCEARQGMKHGSINIKIPLTATQGTYYHAFGSFNISFSGNFKKGWFGKYAFSGTWTFSDTYNWHDGMVAHVLGTEIEDKWALLVEEYRGVAPFDEIGEWKGTVRIKCPCKSGNYKHR